MNSKNARVLDANLNRVREGLRVCEDICRFVWEREEWFFLLRELRHQVSRAALEKMNLSQLIQSRESEDDLGRGIDAVSIHSSVDAQEIFLRNLQRVKEGFRVLEEFGQGLDPVLRQTFQTFRYRVYDLEKNILTQLNEHQKLPTLRHSG